MEHIKDYFTSAVKKIFEKKTEKEDLIKAIYESSNILLKNKEIKLRGGVAKLAVFGTKRTVILSKKDLIINRARELGVVIQHLD